MRWTEAEYDAYVTKLGVAPRMMPACLVPKEKPAVYENRKVIWNGVIHDAGKSLMFTLPWPPSMNHYWRSVGNRVLLAKPGRQYRKQVELRLHVTSVPRGFLIGKLAVEIDAFPPDRRVRDLDNLLKGTLDALKHCAVIRDDADIDDLHIRRCGVVDGGELRLAIHEMAP